MNAPSKPSDHFWDDLSRLHAADASTLGPALEHLAAPTICDRHGTQLARFHSLPVNNQLAVLLALRNSGSKFPREGIAAVQHLAASAASPPIVQSLAGAGTNIPPCPSFLYTSIPAFPWAPQLCTPEEAAARAQTEQQQSMMEIDTENPPHQNVDLIKQAQAAVRSAISSIKDTTEITSLPADASSALDTVLIAAAGAGPSQGEILESAGLTNLSHTVLLLLLTAAVSPASSFSRCAVVARGLLLPALAELNEPPTQSLAAAAQHLADINSQAFIEHCCQPLLSSSGLFSKHQAEFLIKSIKQGIVANAALHSILDAACDGTLWNDHVVSVVQSTIDAKPSSLPPSTISAVCSAFVGAGNGSSLKGSIKLAKALLAFIKAFGKEFQPEDVEKCRTASQAIGTFMAKPTLTALDKLSSS